MKLCGKEMKKFGTNSDIQNRLPLSVLTIIMIFVALLSFVRLFVPSYVRSLNRSLAVSVNTRLIKIYTFVTNNISYNSVYLISHASQNYFNNSERYK